LECDDHSLEIKASQVKLKYAGHIYLEQELYGQNLKAENQETPGGGGGVEDGVLEEGKECVVCLSEGRVTAVLPCRHLSLCDSCANIFRLQANKCPICRSPVKALLKIRSKKKI